VTGIKEKGRAGLSAYAEPLLTIRASNHPGDAAVHSG
jgi:hypothetical protein